MVEALFDGRIALALPSLAGYTLDDTLCRVRELGFQSVMGFPGGPRTRHSLGEFPTFGLYGADDVHTQKVRESLAGFRHISMHQAWDSDWEAWVDCATAVGAEVLTVHASLPAEAESRTSAIASRAAVVRRIGECAEEAGVRVGIENEGGPVDEYLALVDRVDHPAVGATVDVGHCAFFGEVKRVGETSDRVRVLNDVTNELVGTLGEKLVHMHAHDVRGDDWRDHRSVGSGVVDYARLFGTLGEIGYAGLFDVELEEADRERAARETGARLTALCQDAEP